MRILNTSFQQLSTTQLQKTYRSRSSPPSPAASFATRAGREAYQITNVISDDKSPQPRWTNFINPWAITPHWHLLDQYPGNCV